MVYDPRHQRNAFLMPEVIRYDFNVWEYRSSVNRFYPYRLRLGLPKDALAAGIPLV